MGGHKIVNVPFKRLAARLDQVILKDRLKDYDISLWEGEHIALLRNGCNTVTVYVITDEACLDDTQLKKLESLRKFLANRPQVESHNIRVGCKKARPLKPKRYVQARGGSRKINRAADTYRSAQSKLCRKVGRATNKVRKAQEDRKEKWQEKTEGEKLLSRQAVKRSIRRQRQ